MKKIVFACLAVLPAFCGAVSDELCENVFNTVHAALNEKDYDLAMDLCQVMRRHAEVPYSWKYHFSKMRAEIAQDRGDLSDAKHYLRKVKKEFPKEMENNMKDARRKLAEQKLTDKD